MTITRFCRITDGRTVSYREQGAGPVLVMLHGWGMSSAVFKPFMDRLAPSCRVLAPDLCGHGNSDGGSEYDLKHFAADIEEWLSLVDVEDFSLFGWSLGGMVALELANRLEDRVRKLVLVSTTPCFVQKETWENGQPAAQLKILARQFRRNPGATMEGFFKQQFDGEGLTEQNIQTLLKDIPGGIPVPCEEAALGGLETLARADLRKFSPPEVPALVMHGAVDTIIPAAAGEYLAGKLTDAQWILFGGRGHAPFLSIPEQCASLVLDFLS